MSTSKSKVNKISCTASFEVFDSLFNGLESVGKGKVLLKGKQGSFDKVWKKLVQGINKRVPKSNPSASYDIHLVSINNDKVESGVVIKDAHDLECM